MARWSAGPTVLPRMSRSKLGVTGFACCHWCNVMLRSFQWSKLLSGAFLGGTRGCCNSMHGASVDRWQLAATSNAAALWVRASSRV